jgi:tripartite-type tricarboxylate transporter receptor subunit TctC
MMARRTGLAWMLGAALPSVGAARAADDSTRWPPRTLRLVVAYPAGGVSSAVARALAQVLERQTGSTVLVDHRPGAGGTLAMDAVARSAGDGALLVFSAITPLTLAPWLGPLPYDPQRDIAAAYPVMATPVLLLGTPALRASGFAEALALARAAPGALRWATSGHGTTGHLVLERVAAAAQVRITHVPYQGGGQQLTDALGGQFELLSSNVAAAQLRFVREGRLRALAVTGAQRLAQLPEVPTLAELGFADANAISVFGLFAAGRTPPALLERINAALAAAASDPALQQQLAETGNLPLGGSAAAFAQRIAQEREAHRAWLAQPAGR